MVLVRLYGRSERIGSLLRRLCDGAYRRGPDVVEFARLHNAKIHVDSELGKGTRMELIF